MADLTPEILDEVAAACKAGAEEAAEAFTRTLDAPITLSAGQPGTLQMHDLPAELDGPGLAVVLVVGSTGALVLLPESSGLVPPWCADPDPTGQSKLTTLAQELGMLVLPEQFIPEDVKTARVENLAEALRRGAVSDGAGIVPLELSAEGKQGTARVIWPAPKPEAVFGSAPGGSEPAAGPEPAAEAKPTPEPKPAAEAEPKPEPKPAAEAEPKPEPKPVPKPKPAAKPKAKPKGRKTRLKELPDYTQSLLRIEVPVVVTLAETRQPLGRIAELGAGSIIQFDKSCEEMLEMSVGDHLVATGEAVKVGDKFGLRITSIVLPEERFSAVKAVQK